MIDRHDENNSKKFIPYHKNESLQIKPALQMVINGRLSCKGNKKEREFQELFSQAALPRFVRTALEFLTQLNRRHSHLDVWITGKVKDALQITKCENNL